MNSKALWALAGFKFLSGLTKIGILSFLTATATVKWSEIDSFSKLCISLSVAATVLTFAEGFFDQTAARLASGKPPIGTNGSGNTEHFTKTETETPKTP